MDNCVTLLGTKGGPAIRPGTPMPTSILVRLAGQVILVDAGLGVSRAVCDAGVALSDLDAIIVTHMHSDHYLELGPLMHTAWTAGLKRAVPIYGPAGLTAYWQGFLASMEADISLRIADEGRPALEPLADLRLLDAGQFAIGSVTVDAIRNEHPPLIDSFALHLAGDGKSTTLSGDTAPIDMMIDFAKDTDLLVHEAMLSAGIDALCKRVGNGDDRLRVHLERSHSPAAEVAKIATAAGVKQLALNHLIPSDDPDFTLEDWHAEIAPHYSGPLFVGTDGMTIPL